MKDPTRKEMLAHLATLPYASELSELEMEEAIYWFAVEFHGGQGSNLYEALCTSPYKPGAVTYNNEVTDGVCFGALFNEYAKESPTAPTKTTL